MAMSQFVIPLAVVPEGNTLKHFLIRRFPKGMPEDCIATALRSTLKGLHDIHTMHAGGEPEVNTGRIGVFWGNLEYFPYSVRLAYHEEHMQMGGAGDDPERPQVGLWGVGIVALELAYGSLPENITPQQMVTMADNLVRILRQKLLNQQKKIKKLPNDLRMLLDELYVDRREAELVIKNHSTGIFKGAMALRSTVQSLPAVGTRQKRSFSRDFLEVVMRCLDKENPTPIEQILELPFLANVMPNDWEFFLQVVE